MAICNKMGKISVFFSRFLNKILAGPLSLFNITYDMSFYSGCFTRGTKCENPRSNLGFSPTFDQKFSYYRLDFSQNLGKWIFSGNFSSYFAYFGRFVWYTFQVYISKNINKIIGQKVGENPRCSLGFSHFVCRAVPGTFSTRYCTGRPLEEKTGRVAFPGFAWWYAAQHSQHL